jgi:hypothetical protein
MYTDTTHNLTSWYRHLGIHQVQVSCQTSKTALPLTTSVYSSEVHPTAYVMGHEVQLMELGFTNLNSDPHSLSLNAVYWIKTPGPLTPVLSANPSKVNPNTHASVQVSWTGFDFHLWSEDLTRRFLDQHVLVNNLKFASFAVSTWTHTMRLPFSSTIKYSYSYDLLSKQIKTQLVTDILGTDSMDHVQEWYNLIQ